MSHHVPRAVAAVAWRPSSGTSPSPSPRGGGRASLSLATRPEVALDELQPDEVARLPQAHEPEDARHAAPVHGHGAELGLQGETAVGHVHLGAERDRPARGVPPAVHEHLARRRSANRVRGRRWRLCRRTVGEPPRGDRDDRRRRNDVHDVARHLPRRRERRRRARVEAQDELDPGDLRVVRVEPAVTGDVDGIRHRERHGRQGRRGFARASRSRGLEAPRVLERVAADVSRRTRRSRGSACPETAASRTRPGSSRRSRARPPARPVPTTRRAGRPRRARSAVRGAWHGSTLQRRRPSLVRGIPAHPSRTIPRR